MSRLTELINHYEHSVEYLAENWDVTTRHMEMGEIRQHREYCQIENNTLSALKELQRYKELAEAGRLIELPCKDGTDTYCILARYNFKRRESEYYIEVFPFEADMVKGMGEKFFLTKAEAEAKLAEIQKGE